MSKPGVAHGLAVAAALVLLGCGAAPEVPPSRTEVGERVGHLLYADGLIAVPEVNTRMRASVLAIDRDGAAADSVLAAFHEWLSEWAAAHPGQVARARAALPPGRPGMRHAPRRATAAE